MTFNPLEAYTRMALIRRVEEAIAARYPEGKMRTPTHLSIGQEAPAVGCALAAFPGDQAFSNHRCHAHYMAWGGDVDAMIAELFGKASGCAGGWGGSMHLVDEACGFLGTSAIVGSGVSVAVGAALANKLDGNGKIVWAFMGDAARETGQLFEALNFAALKRLPIVFVCEDNGYATQTHIKERQPAPTVFPQIPGALGINTYTAHQRDGIEEVWRMATFARRVAPAFLTVMTYRYLEHVGPNEDWGLGYRQENEGRLWRQDDPLDKLTLELSGLVEAGTLERIDAAIGQRVKLAFSRAELAPWPEANW